MTQPALYQTDLKGLKLLNRGKVRDIYDLGECLLIVATDRISAFDVIMPNPIPGKGEVLTKLSEFWFRQMADIIGNHLVTHGRGQVSAECKPHRDILKGRSMLVKKAKPLPWSVSFAATSADRPGRTTRADGPCRESSFRGTEGIRQASRTDIHPVNEGPRGRT